MAFPCRHFAMRGTRERQPPPVTRVHVPDTQRWLTRSSHSSDEVHASPRGFGEAHTPSTAHRRASNEVQSDRTLHGAPRPPTRTHTRELGEHTRPASSHGRSLEHSSSSPGELEQASTSRVVARRGARKRIEGSLLSGSTFDLAPSRSRKYEKRRPRSISILSSRPPPKSRMVARGSSDGLRSKGAVMKPMRGDAVEPLAGEARVSRRAPMGSVTGRRSRGHALECGRSSRDLRHLIRCETLVHGGSRRAGQRTFSKALPREPRLRREEPPAPRCWPGRLRGRGTRALPGRASTPLRARSGALSEAVPLRVRAAVRVRLSELGAGSARGERGAPSDKPDSSPRAEEALSRRQEHDLVYVALDELEPERREVFVMFEIDERPMDEIARDLQVPLTTVVSRLRLARRDFEAAVRRITAKRHHQTAAVVAREVSR